MRNLKDIMLERLVLSKHKKDIFSTIEPSSDGCYAMFVVQKALKKYEEDTGKSYDLSNIYNEWPIFKPHNSSEYEVQDITATNAHVWLGVINTENGKPNEFEFASLGLLATILGKNSTSKGFAIINYIVDDIENILK